jgi:hypothetical protein
VGRLKEKQTYRKSKAVKFQERRAAERYESTAQRKLRVTDICLDLGQGGYLKNAFVYALSFGERSMAKFKSRWSLVAFAGLLLPVILTQVAHAATAGHLKGPFETSSQTASRFLPDPTPVSFLAGCGGKRIRDQITHRCLGPADVRQ